MKPQVLALGLLLSTLAGYSQTSITFRPDSCNGKDATVFVKKYLPEWANKNFGQRDELSASGWTYGGQKGGDGYSRTFIDFTQLKTIPRGTRIDQAILTLSGKDNSIYIDQGNTGPNACFIDRITSPWSEDSITWNKRPAISFQHQTVLPGTNGETEAWNYNVAVDVTALVQDMVDLPADSSHGFCIRLQKETYYVNLAFAASEHVYPTLRPALTLVFDACGTANLEQVTRVANVDKATGNMAIINQTTGEVEIVTFMEDKGFAPDEEVSEEEAKARYAEKKAKNNTAVGTAKKAVKSKKK